MRGKQAYTILVLVALLVAMPVVGVVVADSHGSTASTPRNESDGYTIDELRQGGTVPGDSPDSVRIVDDERAYWVEYMPPDKPWLEDTQMLKPGATVGANEVFLRTIRMDAETTTENVTVVYWERGTETRQVGNETVTEQVATNVTVTQHQVSFEQGWNKESINLRQNDDEVIVTMWLTDHPDEGRWVFKHESTPTSREANINSQGDYWLRVLTSIIGPTLLGALVAGVVGRGAIKRAGIGPKWGFVLWGLVLSVTGFISMVTIYGTIAEMLVELPVIVPVGVSLVFLFVMLETQSDGLERRQYIRPNTEDAVSPNGEKAIGWLDADTKSHYVVDMGDGEAIVKKGMLRFLARLAGSAAYIQHPEKIKSRVKDNTGKYDELVFVDPNSDEIVDYTPEGFTLDLPDPDSSIFNKGLTVIVKSAVTIVPWMVVEPRYGAAIALAATLPVAGAMWLTARDGEAYIEPAPVHFEDAVATSVELAERTDEYRTNDELRRENYQHQADKQAEAERRVDERDSTLIERMFDWDVDASTTSAATDDGPRVRDDGDREDKRGEDDE